MGLIEYKAKPDYGIVNDSKTACPFVTNPYLEQLKKINET
jgi:hypothetical protein